VDVLRSWIHRAAIASLLAGVAAGGPATAHANGRPPRTTGVAFPTGQPGTILLPVTFGLLVSSDDGESFRWVCEAAIGYSGIFDPDYAVTADGVIHASSEDGLRRSRDGACTFETVGADIIGGDGAHVSEVEIGPDGRIWVATRNAGGPNDVFVSADGETFASSNLAADKAWWLSLRTAAEDPERIYVSGFQPQDGPAPPAALLRRSDTGGASWQELPVADFAFGDLPELFLVGVSPIDPDVVFARVTRDGGIADDLYRSTDAGETWTRVAQFADLLTSFLIRADGQTVIAASIRACPEDISGGATDAGVPLHGCVRVSGDGGASWRRPAEQPRLACLGERSDRVLFGCAANWDPDNFALGRSSDGEAWETVYRFEDTVGPLECEAGTVQAQCAAQVWPSVCPMAGACPRPDAGPAAEGDGGGAGDGGCCRVSDASGAGEVPGLALVLLALFLWRRARSRV
jgi:hypothetical protein